MSNVDVNKIKQIVKELQDQNAIDFQQWKKLGKHIEKLSEKIKLSDTNLNLLMKKIKNDYEKLRKVIIDENVQVQLNEKLNNKVDNETFIEKINKKVDNETFNAKIKEKVDNTTFTNKINDFDKQLLNVEIDVENQGFQKGVNGDVESNTNLIQSLIDNYDDIVFFFPSGVNKIGKLNLGTEKNITFKGKSSSFATSVNKSTSTPKVVDTYTQILINLDSEEAWLTHQNCTIIFDKISIINGVINDNGIVYSNNNLMVKTEKNTTKGKIFATESSFIGWKILSGDKDILIKDIDILQSCWLCNRCRFRNNIIGLTQLVDSRIIDCSFNKNDYAIIMKKNSGFSTILGNRIEWNNQRAITVINAHDVTISNNEFDRNSKAALVVDNLEVGSITNNVFRRNGALDTLEASDYDDNIHFSLKNCNNVVLKGNVTKVQSILDTSSGGKTRPSNCANISNNTNCIIAENILNGCSKSDKESANKIENNTTCIIKYNIPLTDKN